MSAEDIIDMTGDSSEAEEDVGEAKAEIKREYAHYGSNTDEINDYLGGVIRGRYRFLVQGRMRPMRKVPDEPTVYIMLTRARHWVGIGLDMTAMCYAVIGSRSHLGPFRSWMEASGISPTDLRNVTPAVGAQEESECGAYVAVFAEWFVNEREAGARRRRPIPRFRERVRELMAEWRAARR